LLIMGGQLPGYRRRVLDRLLELDGDKKPYLLLATHAMEVGVDISSEVMFCGAGKAGFSLGPDSFVQQIGRCARRREEDGDVYLEGVDPAKGIASREGGARSDLALGRTPKS
jgi:CRISPR-associated endonuclease/helicase Cas3